MLVVGEAKRGKSTFVNALIGRDILPTAVEVATSQVFNVRPAKQEAYRLRFEDGSARQITAADLPRYGSQIMADAGVVPAPNEIIRWIEVDVPVRFLPPGVSILDTPGLGTLYAGHARITHRFVPEADAVIFVLESGQPVVREDLKFIEQILAVTRKIFFVQTKIDQYNKEDWQNDQRRNMEILARQFKGRLADTRVWPVSSTNLRKAASANKKTEEAYLMVSRHKELAAGLKAFLARLAGWDRAAEAMAAAVPYYTTSRKALEGRLAGLTADSKQRQAELQKIAAEGKRQFEAEWGPQGRKYRELKEGLQRAIAVGKQSFANTLQPGNDIELAQKAKIEAVTSLNEAKQVAEEMPDEVIMAAVNNWVEICEEVRRRCIELLGPFAEAVENMSAPLDPELSGVATTDGGADDKFKRDYFSMLRGAAGGGMLVMGVSSMASLVVPAVATTALASVAPFVAVPVLAVLVGSGVKGVLKGQVKTAQGQLRMQLMEMLQQIRRHFFDADLSAGSFSRVDEYFKSLERAVNEQVQELVREKSKEAQAEISRLAQARQLDGGEREAQTKQVQQQLAQWDNIGKYAKQVTAQMEALKRPKAPAKT
ncbi:MAG TPA: dynamin family protein [Actinomycetota bacterium]|nr:dynamin family protein [Actinomycetota bacterium]